MREPSTLCCLHWELLSAAKLKSGMSHAPCHLGTAGGAFISKTCVVLIATISVYHALRGRGAVMGIRITSSIPLVIEP